MSENTTHTKIATWEDLRKHYESLRGIDWKQEAHHWSGEALEWANSFQTCRCDVCCYDWFECKRRGL